MFTKNLWGCAGQDTYQAPKPGAVDVVVDPNSNRLQLLTPFDAWNGKDLEVCLLGWNPPLPAVVVN